MLSDQEGSEGLCASTPPELELFPAPFAVEGEVPRPPKSLVVGTAGDFLLNMGRVKLRVRLGVNQKPLQGRVLRDILVRGGP